MDASKRTGYSNNKVLEKCAMIKTAISNALTWNKEDIPVLEVNNNVRYTTATSVWSSIISACVSIVLQIAVVVFGGYTVLFLNSYDNILVNKTSYALTKQGIEESVHIADSMIRYKLDETKDRRPYYQMFFATYTEGSKIVEKLEEEELLDNYNIVGERTAQAYEKYSTGQIRNTEEVLEKAFKVEGIYVPNMSEDEIQIIQLLYKIYPAYKSKTELEEDVVMKRELSEETKNMMQPDKNKEKQTQRYKEYIETIRSITEMYRKRCYRFVLLAGFFLQRHNEEIAKLVSKSL